MVDFVHPVTYYRQENLHLNPAAADSGVKLWQTYMNTEHNMDTQETKLTKLLGCCF